MNLKHLKRAIVFKFGSLRAAAGPLGVSESNLSMILSSKYPTGIPKRLVDSWSDVLSVPPSDLIDFMRPRARMEYLTICRAQNPTQDTLCHTLSDGVSESADGEV